MVARVPGGCRLVHKWLGAAGIAAAQLASTALRAGARAVAPMQRLCSYATKCCRNGADKAPAWPSHGVGWARWARSSRHPGASARVSWRSCRARLESVRGRAVDEAGSEAEADGLRYQGGAGRHRRGRKPELSIRSRRLGAARAVQQQPHPPRHREGADRQLAADAACLHRHRPVACLRLHDLRRPAQFHQRAAAVRPHLLRHPGRDADRGLADRRELRHRHEPARRGRPAPAPGRCQRRHAARRGLRRPRLLLGRSTSTTPSA